MTKSFGKIESRFWTSPDIAGLSDQSKLLALYLLTCSHGDMLGIFRLPPGYIMSDLNWSKETVSKQIRNLESNGFLTVSKQLDFICINHFQRFNPPANRNMFLARIKAFESLPAMGLDVRIPAMLMMEKASEYKDSASFVNRIETVSERFASLGGESQRVRESERQ